MTAPLLEAHREHSPSHSLTALWPFHTFPPQQCLSPNTGTPHNGIPTPTPPPMWLCSKNANELDAGWPESVNYISQSCHFGDYQLNKFCLALSNFQDVSAFKEINVIDVRLSGSMLFEYKSSFQYKRISMYL